MKISQNPFTNSPEVGIEASDIKDILQLIKNQLKKRVKSPFAFYKDNSVFDRTLINSINYLIKDQIRGNEEAGAGWGYSDKAYMTYLYGEEKGNVITDSVMTSSVNYLALRKYELLIENPRKINYEIIDIKKNLEMVSKYFLSRWDKKKGVGGTFQYSGREAEYKINPSYRHTGWLLKVWLQHPSFKERIVKTANYLINEFEYIDLKEQKVATDIAVYISLKELLSDRLFQNEIDYKRIGDILLLLESSIIGKYNNEICGWSSGNDIKKGRQLYTLFTLAELIGIVNKDSDIYKCLLNAYKATFCENSKYILENSMVKYEDGPKDINSTCLAISILNRKSNLDKYEKKLFKEMCNYLIYKLEDANNFNNSEQVIYSWTLSYFVIDLCDYFISKYDK